MKKIISIILSLLMIIGIIITPSKVHATFKIEETNLYSKGTSIDYLHFGNIGIVCDYVVYAKDGQEYPAYCLNKDLKGASEGFSYSVNANELLTNVKVWRTIINGYPYKTYQELGCANKEEAYLATKQAVYCAIYNRDPDAYVGRNEIGKRTLNALKQIVANANNSTEVKASADLTVQDVTSKWQQDEIDGKYISKKFAIKANSTINSYSVELEEITVEGAKIVDEKNNEKKNFKYGENFKIIIPITNMIANGSFNIKVNGKVATKPILYAYSTDPNLQDYALTGNIYEDGSGIKTINYTKNETKIIVQKQDEKKNPLEGVKFNLLDENKQILYTELTTNKEGKVTIENLIPGTYYLEETSTLNGYAVYEEQIEAKVGYNEELTVKVTNTKEEVTLEKPEITENEKEVINETIEPGKEKPEIIENSKEVIVRLPKTGM